MSYSNFVPVANYSCVTTTTVPFEPQQVSLVAGCTFQCILGEKKKTDAKENSIDPDDLAHTHALFKNIYIYIVNMTNFHLY